MNAQHKQYIGRLEASGKELVKALDKVSQEDLMRPPKPGEWSLHQNAAHLRDVEEQVFLYRLKRILSEDLPAVQNFDQEAWMREHYTPAEPIQDLARDFVTARRQVVKLLRATKDKDWARCALHPIYGKISVEWLALHNYAHTYDHLAQVLYANDEALLKRLQAQ